MDRSACRWAIRWWRSRCAETFCISIDAVVENSLRVGLISSLPDPCLSNSAITRFCAHSRASNNGESNAAHDKTRFDSIVEDLKRTRDELRVKLHLGAADARAEWEAVEKKWSHLEGRLGVLGKEAGAAGENVGEALELVAKEIRRGV